MQTCLDVVAKDPGTLGSCAKISARKLIGESCERDLPETEALLRELERVNRILGVYRTVAHALVPWCAEIARRQGCVRLVESGCGSGGLLLSLSRTLHARGIHASLLGLDPNPAAISCARRNRQAQ